MCWSVRGGCALLGVTWTVGLVWGSPMDLALEKRGVLSLKRLVFFCIVVVVFVSVYMEMKALGMTWGVFLRAVVFYGTLGIFLMLGYEVMQRRGVKKGLFFKMVVLSFILAAVTDFIYKKAEHLGLAEVWFSNRWVFHMLFGVVFGLVLGLIYRGAKRLGFRLSFFEKD
ncbi:hypothetical protein [Bartonella grahamii]|uniref:Uncharacterized protein n=1 Tax=Bartonella grahamii TaxID=33045 RepID=A0A336NCP8_BARGR|nr:hypothetical protein [Bartonella grahamii]SSZ39429.1 Uncharacterised protein [Bartonella grahamii]